MRRRLTILPALVALGALGCNDGPSDTYQPAPANAGWNSGTSMPAAQNGSQAFDAGYPTIDKTSVCSTDLKRQRWAWMLTQPIVPPRHYAGLDMALNDNWDGLKIDNAEQPPAMGDPMNPGGGLCQSVALGFQGTCPSGFGGCNGNYWGNNQEVTFFWNVATHFVDQMTMVLGYQGVMQTGPYPDHNGDMHSYAIAIGDVVRRDGQPFEIPWTGNPNIEITDIFNATMATFAPKAGVPFDMTMCTKDSDCKGAASNCQCDHSGGANPGDCTTGKPGQCGVANCGSDGNCLIVDTGSLTYFGIRPMVVYIVGQAGLPQPALSTPAEIYNFFSKWMPFSYLPQVVKLDAQGPVSSGTPIGTPPNTVKTCTQQIGTVFSDFDTNCVQVTGNPTVDQVNLNKVTHSLTHDQEHWTANVLGVNQNFTSLSVINSPDKVVLDTDQPQPGDIAQDWTFDVRARGHTQNEWGPTNACTTNADCPNWDSGDTTAGTCAGGASFRGSELIYIEYAREMLAATALLMSGPGATPRTLGDPACTGYDPGTGQPTHKVTNAAIAATCPSFPVGCSQVPCTGLEGLVVPSVGAGDFTGDASCLPASTIPCLDPGSSADHTGIYGAIGPVLRPGSASGELCIDPADPFPSDCTSDTNKSIWQNILTHVTRVLGNGDVLNLPSEFQDRRYYYKFWGSAYVKYLKAYGNYNPATRDNYPVNGANGLGPSDVMNQTIDLESLFFDYTVQPGTGAAQTFDKFEYIDRDWIGQGNGGTYNWIPWDFEYGCDLFGGNQRYDNWFRRMDREEIAMYASMMTDKTHTPGQENNVNVTNLFGSLLLGGDPNSAVPGIWPSYACAIGAAGDPLQNCISGQTGGPTNPPLDPTNPSNAAQCDFGKYAATGCAPAAGKACTTSADCYTGTCDPGTHTCPGAVCGGGQSYENGFVSACGPVCDFGTYANTGCKSPSQTCAGGACIDMKMDKNGAAGYTPTGSATAQVNPLLYYYPGVWGRTPFARGHSPITLAQADKQPDIGVAKITIPNFQAGPYTMSPMGADNSAPPCQGDGDCVNTGNCSTAMTCAPCPHGYTETADKVWCNAALNAGTGYQASSFTPLTPWLEVQPDVGFNIPIDGQHWQWVSTGQFDFTGVLEAYVVDYLPYIDPTRQSCVAGAGPTPNATCKIDSDCGSGVCSNNTKTCVPCHDGFTCDPTSHSCFTNDNTLQVAAIEGEDFLGQAFVCQDPWTGDILHVGMFDSAEGILDWLAAHPGGANAFGPVASAQVACNILVIRSPADNFVDFIIAKQWGVSLNIGGGQGLGRVTDIILWDPNLQQGL